MKSIRIGKDIGLTWTITTNGEAVSLEGADLTLQLIDPKGCVREMEFTVSGNVLSFVFHGTEQSVCGSYQLTLWQNYGQTGQTVVDKTSAFRLVPNTDLEKDE